MEFKERLKELRIKHNLTQADLAKALNKGDSTPRTWELGGARPDIDTLIKLSRLFGVTTDYLLGVVDDDRAAKLIECAEECSYCLCAHCIAYGFCKENKCSECVGVYGGYSVGKDGCSLGVALEALREKLANWILLNPDWRV